MVFDALLEDRIKQGPRFPRRTREHLVIGRPIFLGVALKTDGARERPFAHPAENAESQSNRPLQAAHLRENKPPPLRVLQKRVEQFHGETRC